jgi:hypothetical protein
LFEEVLQGDRSFSGARTSLQEIEASFKKTPSKDYV